MVIPLKVVAYGNAKKLISVNSFYQLMKQSGPEITTNESPMRLQIKLWRPVFFPEDFTLLKKKPCSVEIIVQRDQEDSVRL